MAQAYEDLVQRLSERFDAALKNIEVEHNFEYGVEFEAVLCEVLQRALPHRFGVCRGYIVDKACNSAGDDVIIYDKSRFTTLRGIGPDAFGRKERVPADAVYAYVEAKHTLELDGDGGQSISKAARQVADAKRVMSNRQPVPVGVQVPGGPLLTSAPSPGQRRPQVQNPPFGMIFARNIRKEAGADIANDAESVLAMLGPLMLPNQRPPDLIVAGPNVVILPATGDGGQAQITEPFFIDGDNYTPLNVPERAFGIGLTWLFWALDRITLGAMPWPEIIVDAANTPRGASPSASPAPA